MKPYTITNWYIWKNVKYLSIPIYNNYYYCDIFNNNFSQTASLNSVFGYDEIIEKPAGMLMINKQNNKISN